jgi:serine/threonine-protein kinase
VLCGRYALDRFIGGGSSGSVYAALDRRLQRHVAIKVIHPEHARTPEQRKRILQEALLGARISHPNVAPLLDLGVHLEDDPRAELQPFLVMPLYDGRTLRQLLHDGPLPWVRSVQLVRQLLSGLGALHAAGVVHRDVKLDNCILVHEGGREVLKLIDLGLAKVTRGGLLSSPPYSVPGALVGTYLYVAPELVLGEPADERSDLYAVGVILYELLVRHPPFRGSIYEVIAGHVERTPSRPSEVAAGSTPQTLDDVLSQALAKRREARFASTTAFDAALVRVLEAEAPEVDAYPITAGAAEAQAALAAWADFEVERALAKAEAASRLARAWSPLYQLLCLHRDEP